MERGAPHEVDSVAVNRTSAIGLYYLEDHPKTCKWLVTPIYRPQKGNLEGEQPLLTGHTDHGYLPLTNWDDPPSRRCPRKLGSKVIGSMGYNPTVFHV